MRVVMLSVCGWHRVATTVRRTMRLRTGRFTVPLVMTRFLMTRFCAIALPPRDSATWTAPPPITAPAHRHAHNFVTAILTDMITLPHA